LCEDFALSLMKTIDRSSNVHIAMANPRMNIDDSENGWGGVSLEVTGATNFDEKVSKFISTFISTQLPDSE